MSLLRQLTSRAAVLPLLIVLAGTLASAVTGWQLHTRQQHEAQARFQHAEAQVQQEVTRRFTSILSGLRGARGLYAASQRIERAEFRTFVDSLRVDTHFPGVRGFGFIARFARGEEDAFVAAERADDAPDFALREVVPSVHAQRYVIKFIEPVARNRQAVGLDVGSERNRRQAIERAIRSGRPALTDPIVLVQDGRHSPGFLLYLPVYQDGTIPASEAERERALLGVLYAPVVAAELLAGASEAMQLDFELLALDRAGGAPTLVFDADGHLGGALPAEPAADGSRRHVASHDIDLLGSPFALRVSSTPAFEAATDEHNPWLVAGVGIVLTGFLAYLAWLTAAGRARAEALAQRMTVELDRLATVARRTSDGVLILDLDRRITWANESFQRITGFSIDESRGRLPSELLRAEPGEDGSMERLRAAQASNEGFKGLYRNRRKDGSEYWSEVEVQPLWDAEGRKTGFMAVESDITERKQIELALAAAVRDNEALLGTIRTYAIVSVAGPDGRIVEVNDAFCAISGYTREELLGQDHRIVNSGTHPKDFWAEMWRTIGAGRPWRGQVCNRARDGSLYWVDSIVAPFVGADGRIEKFVSVRTDVSASVRATQELAQQRERLGQIIEATNAGTWEVNLQTGEDLINDNYAAMLGYGVDEMRARIDGNFLAVVHPDDWAAVTEARQAHVAGRTSLYEVEFRMQHRDGRWMWILSRGRIGQRDADGRPLWMTGIHLDITARKHAERELSRQSQRLGNILEGTNVGTWEWNVESGDMVINERWAQMVGHTLDDLAPIDIGTWSRLCHPDDLTHWSQLLERHWDGETEDYECEARMRHKAGHWVWVLVRGRLYGRTAEGAPRWMAGTHMDITERKRAEQALRDSQAFLDTAGRIASVGGWQIDLVSGEIAWSDETCRIHGLPAGHRPLLEEMIDCYAPEVQEQLRSLLIGGIASGAGWDVVLPLRARDGRTTWVRHLGRQEAVDGEAVRLVGAVQDVTERRALENELRRSSEVMANIVENLPCGVSVFNAELELVAANQKYREVLGFPDHLFEAARPRFETFIRYNAERGEYGEGDVDAIVAAAMERARGPTVPHRFERLRSNGTPIEVQGAPMPGGGFVTTYTDISELKRAEREVARNAALLRGAIDAVDEAFVLYDPDDRLLFCNQKYRDLYAASADLIVPGARFEDIIREGARRGQYAAAVGREEAWVAERMAVHREGNSSLVQHLDDGRVVRVIEQRMADGHTVGFRIDVTDLARATEAAQEASRAKSQFLANMSHEIRTPMNAILGMLALLRKTELTARQADYATKTEGAARSLLGLLNDILDFSKAEAGKMELDPQPFQVDELMRNLAVILSANAAGKDIEVLFDIDPAVPRHLIGDAMRLQQVLINLGGNAIKFTAHGEVVVKVEVVGCDEDKATLDVSVRDTGIGIAPEHHERIFSGFTQAEASTTRRYGGTGLGVAICQRLVRLMGGELRLDSAPGRGSRFHFRVTMPLAEAAAQVQASDPASAAGLSVLIVDDNPSAREIMGAMADSLGWSVALADSGESALARLQAEPGGFDAVFVDWQMPGLDGWQTCERIRAGALAGAAPLLVMVTAHGREMLAQRSDQEQSRLDGFLVKPVTASMLLDAVMDARRGTASASPSEGRQGTARRLAGLRLLVAEDNANNQQVARELLEDEGAEVHIAADGYAAVLAVTADEPRFDAVLMDLQMPVMDGYTATSQIRQRLGPQDLPIIAMTANAMASDREACLAAGMNDHVGKPFDLDHLVRVLRRLCGRDEAPATARAPAAPTSDAVRQAADAAEIDLTAALERLGGNEGAYRRLLRNFVADLAAVPAQLRAQAEAGAWAEAGRQFHTLKGLGATLGLNGVAAQAAAAEKAIAGGLCDPAEPVWLAALAALESALPALQRFNQAFDAPAAAPVDGAPVDAPALKASLQALSGLLADADMEALAVMDGLREQAAGTLAPRLAQLDEAVGRLDFDSALQACKALIDALPT